MSQALRPIDANRLTESVKAFGIKGAGWSDSERESDVHAMIENEPTLNTLPVKSTGTIRRIDELGRIVIPPAVRREVGIKDDDPLEISFIKDDNGYQIILRLYKPAEATP